MPRLLKLGIAPLDTARAQARWLLELADREADAAGRSPTHVEIIELRAPGEPSGELFLDAEALGAGHQEVLRRALAAGQVNLILHHLGDRPGTVPVRQLAAVLPRLAPGDALLGRSRLGELEPGARVAVGSQRSRALLRRARPDVHVVHLRGGPTTCIDKLRAGHVDALVLPAAIVRWLGEEARLREELPLDAFLPGAGQGLLGLEATLADPDVRGWAARLDDPASRLAAAVEVAIAERLQGAATWGAYAEVSPARVRLDAFVAGWDGEGYVYRSAELPSPYDEASALQLAHEHAQSLMRS